MVEKNKKIIGIYPEESEKGIKYQAVKVIKGGWGFKVDDANVFGASDMEQILNNTPADLVVGVVPSQNCFQRVINLPPIPEKRIPEVVKFEAAQQIPFDINDVYWNWKFLTNYPEDPELKIKVAAIKKGTVEKCFPFKKVNFVTSIPESLPSLYQKPGDEKLEGILAIGKTSTDIIICKNGNNYWNRLMLYGSENDEVRADGKSDLGTDIKRTLGFWQQKDPNEKIDCLLYYPQTKVLPERLEQISNEAGIHLKLVNPYNKFENSEAITGDYLYAAAGVLATENAVNLMGNNKYKFKKRKTQKEPFIWKIGKAIENLGKSLQR